MTSKEILDSFVKDFISRKDESVCYIYYPTELARQCLESQKNQIKDYDLRDPFSPMPPFFNIIREENPSEELISKYAYSLHRESFISYFKTGVVVDRKDMVITEEIKYEKQEFYKTMMALIRELCTGIYVIYNAQWLCKEALDIIEKIEAENLSSKFILIFDSTVVRFDKTFISEFIERKQLGQNFLNIYTHQVVPSSGKTLSRIPKTKEIINSIRNAAAFLLTSNLEQLCEKIEKYGDKLKISERQRRELSYYLGYAYYICGDTDQACLSFSRALDIKKNDELGIKAMYYLSAAFYIKKMNTAAYRYASMVMQRTKQIPRSRFYAASAMVQYFACDRGDTNFLINKYREATKLLRESGLINNYVHTVLNVPGPFINDTKALTEEVHPMIFDCYYAVKRLNNKQGLSDVCNWLGITYSREGNKEEAFKMYKECSDIRQEIGDLVNIIRVRNSLSYEALIISDYKKAFDLLNEYSERFTEIDNYRTIINTLRNIALPLLYTRHFEEAGKIFTAMTQFMNMFDFENMTVNSFLPELNDILIYRSIVELSRSEFSHVQVNLYSILNNGKYISPAVKPLLNFLESVIFLKDGNYIDAVDLFEEGMMINSDIGEVNLHIIAFCYYEFAVMLKRFNHNDESEKYLQKGFKIAKANNLKYYTKGKDSITMLDYLVKGEHFGQINMNLEEIKKNALAERLKNQIHSRVLASQFLNSITSAAIETKDIKHYLQKILPYILDYSMAEGIYIVTRTGDRWKVMDSLNRGPFKSKEPVDWDYYFNEAQGYETCKVFYDAKNKNYYCNISKYNFSAGVLIVTGPQGTINSELINILGLSFSYVQSQLVLYAQKNNLIQASVFDSLTTLRNRRALTDYIIEQRDKIKQISIQYTVAFIDLDNFKYFNDTFGHQAGDIMLKLFANIMKKIYRTGDFLCRYGGDEFIVVIPAATCEEVAETAKRLNKALRKEEYFIPALEDLMEKEIDVPKEYHLGFSMGICSNFDIEDKTNLKQVLKNADDALYYSKNNGKGKVIIWKDIKQ